MNSFLRHSLTLLLLIVSLHAQNSLPRYSVLKRDRGDSYLARLNELAEQGYRVLVASDYTVLRLEATPPDVYRYARFEIRGGPVEFTNWINAWGARGYRWIPKIDLLEKSPHPRNYEYRYSPHGAWGRPSKKYGISSVMNEGYRPLRAATFTHAIGADTYEMFFEREVSHTPSAHPRNYDNVIEVADAVRTGNVMKRVNQLAKQGYRFLGPHVSGRGGGTAVVMEKCLDSCDGRYEYSHLDAKDAVQVERELDTLGKDGFRIIPRMLERGQHPQLLERDAHEKQTFSYRVLKVSDAASLQEALNSVDQEGYEPIDFVGVSGGFWKGQEVLLLEKETTGLSVQ